MHPAAPQPQALLDIITNSSRRKQQRSEVFASPGQGDGAAVGVLAVAHRLLHGVHDGRDDAVVVLQGWKMQGSKC